MITVMLFNAPPKTGKDSACDHVVNTFGCHHLRFKDELYTIAADYVGMDRDELVKLCNNRDFKERPMLEFDDMSPRELLIHVSERVIKPQYGKDFFGKLLSNRLRNGINVISDGGFIEELRAVAGVADRVIVLRLHRDGCDYNNDSRRYFTDDELEELGCLYADIDSNGHVSDLLLSAEIVYKSMTDEDFINGRV